MALRLQFPTPAAIGGSEPIVVPATVKEVRQPAGKAEENLPAPNYFGLQFYLKYVTG
jgi:hypothetical protein